MCRSRKRFCIETFKSNAIAKENQTELPEQLIFVSINENSRGLLGALSQNYFALHTVVIAFTFKEVRE